jgi:hypothetical protein
MPAPDRPPDTPHLVVVRTQGIREHRGAPADAVVEYTFWHPGDRDWNAGYHTSVEDVIGDFTQSGWFLLQRLDLTAPYESELIFVSRYGSFFGQSASEIMDRLGLNPDDFPSPD